MGGRERKKGKKREGGRKEGREEGTNLQVYHTELLEGGVQHAAEPGDTWRMNVSTTSCGPGCDGSWELRGL